MFLITGEPCIREKVIEMTTNGSIGTDGSSVTITPGDHVIGIGSGVLTSFIVTGTASRMWEEGSVAYPSKPVRHAWRIRAKRGGEKRRMAFSCELALSSGKI